MSTIPNLNLFTSAAVQQVVAKYPEQVVAPLAEIQSAAAGGLDVGEVASKVLPAVAPLMGTDAFEPLMSAVAEALLSQGVPMDAGSQAAFRAISEKSPNLGWEAVAKPSTSLKVATPERVSSQTALLRSYFGREIASLIPEAAKLTSTERTTSKHVGIAEYTYETQKYRHDNGVYTLRSKVGADGALSPTLLTLPSGIEVNNGYKDGRTTVHVASVGEGTNRMYIMRGHDGEASRDYQMPARPSDQYPTTVRETLNSADEVTKQEVYYDDNGM